MAEIQATTSNNLITQTLNNTSKVHTTQPNVKKEIIPDTFVNTVDNSVSKNKISNKTLAKVLDFATSLLLFGGFFFLPDIIVALKNKKSNGILKNFKKFKPFIGETVTSQKQEVLKNGRTKITLENIKGRFKFNEILILDKQGKMKQRIIIRKEEMPNGKYITRTIRSFKGDNLVNNNEICKNPDKYLFKEYKRSNQINKEYKTTVKRKGKTPETTTYIGTSDGKPVFRKIITPEYKINTAFLYDSNTCIGTDSQIVPLNNKEEQYSLLNIPKQGIINKKYNVDKDGQQYDKRYLNQLLSNF